MLGSAEKSAAVRLTGSAGQTWGRIRHRGELASGDTLTVAMEASTAPFHSKLSVSLNCQHSPLLSIDPQRSVSKA
jgi:hypothetical protein